ncbi:tRNA (adenosine(37)-N6)-dimethylallyltransferase MiaA [bacterium G20]|nr:tRNA (adenosine(37)-N6)-dimethylallyltransferase MiaA [bacterium G20]
MATTPQRPKLVVIVGPTASGKSALAIQVAKDFAGEIICADSRTVYKGMDIGTAKPSAADRKTVPHWGLDLVTPGKRFTAYRFKKYAQNAILDIQGRAKLPVLAGGTGLYVDSVLFDFGFRQDADLAKRKKLETMNIETLQDFIREMSLPMPLNFKNKRHLIRSIETKGQSGTKKQKLPEGVLLVGLLPTDKVLRQRINARAQAIFRAEVVGETRRLLSKTGREALVTTGGIVYKICLKVLDGKITRTEAIKKFQIADWQYTRRQKTWFKRNKFIHWFESPEQAYSYIKSQLNT